jgi:hypothetical protein
MNQGIAKTMLAINQRNDEQILTAVDGKVI